VTIDGETYYRTGEVCRMAGISRTTLFRWLREGLVRCSVKRDRRGWRLFTAADAEELRSEANRVDGG